ncbi:hypothetical protein RB2654_14685 [Rhodobacterales bacterium HTCC2654]|uniref:Uncharacterized protein n=1 Tax=Maritimibacter alkaliphilus HTCC2654 TaxID=314271 RepID=A3VGY6_9RHOB|nr:hypothetical protein RB2654_14685 [Rhodobacterales bacterium HTCC2654] [Maritimibacter alkaliphilus HTCC2654]
MPGPGTWPKDRRLSVAAWVVVRNRISG